MKQKHLLLIQTDQWSGRLLGAAGNSAILTPTIDQLARDGIRFDSCYSECPVCIPARRSLMTGLSPRTHGDRVYTDTMTMPAVPTLAECFTKAGYQTSAVGKLHVYPQRNRIGFEEVILQEEARYEFGLVDDYQMWLSEKGYTGLEFAHGMGNNTYHSRPWHLPEAVHPTAWATQQMINQIKRRDPTRPGFFYLSYSFPHPPLVPLRDYLDMYPDGSIPDPVKGVWCADPDKPAVLRYFEDTANEYSAREVQLARRAYYAQCTYIDHQIRNVIGTLREHGMLADTVIGFISDHGEMLFDHGMAGKRLFYENSAKVPFILSGKPMAEYRGQVSSNLACLQDIMPTLLGLFDIPVPETVEGRDLFKSSPRETLYGEITEGRMATRMMHDGRFKLIWYPAGNVFQLFDLASDADEVHNLAGDAAYADVLKKLKAALAQQLYSYDVDWVKDGELVGFSAPEYARQPNYGFANQRGLHWPPPPAKE